LIIKRSATLTMETKGTVLDLKQLFSTALAEFTQSEIPDSAETTIIYHKAQEDQRDNWYQPAYIELKVEW